jgi:hypothetical protein
MGKVARHLSACEQIAEARPGSIAAELCVHTEHLPLLPHGVPSDMLRYFRGASVESGVEERALRARRAVPFNTKLLARAGAGDARATLAHIERLWSLLPHAPRALLRESAALGDARADTGADGSASLVPRAIAAFSRAMRRGVDQLVAQEKWRAQRWIMQRLRVNVVAELTPDNSYGFLERSEPILLLLLRADRPAESLLQRERLAEHARWLENFAHGRAEIKKPATRARPGRLFQLAWCDGYNFAPQFEIDRAALPALALIWTKKRFFARPGRMWSAAGASGAAPEWRSSLRTNARADRDEENEVKEFVLDVDDEQDQVLYRPADAEDALGAMTSDAAWAEALFSFVDSIDGELPRLTPTLTCRRFLRSGACAKLRGAFQVDACVKCYEAAPRKFVQSGCAHDHVTKWCRDFQQSAAAEEEQVEVRRAEWRSQWADRTEKRAAAQRAAERAATGGDGVAADATTLAARERRAAILDSVTALFDDDNEPEEDPNEDSGVFALGSEKGAGVVRGDDVAESTLDATAAERDATLNSTTPDGRADVAAAPRARRMRTEQAPAAWLRSVVVRGVRGDLRWLNALYVREAKGSHGEFVNGAPIFVHETRPKDAVLFVSKRGKVGKDGSESMWSLAPRVEVEKGTPDALLANALNPSATPAGQMWKVNPTHRRGSFDVNGMITVSGHAWRAYGGAPWEEWIAAAPTSPANVSYGVAYHDGLLRAARKGLGAELPPSMQTVIEGGVGAERSAYGPATHRLRGQAFDEYMAMLRQVGELCQYYVRETGVDGRPIRREGSTESTSKEAQSAPASCIGLWCSPANGTTAHQPASGALRSREQTAEESAAPEQHSELLVGGAIAANTTWSARRSDEETVTWSAAEEYERSRANAIIGIIGKTLVGIYAAIQRVDAKDEASSKDDVELTPVNMRELVAREGILSEKARGVVRSVCSGDMLLDDGDGTAPSKERRNKYARSGLIVSSPSTLRAAMEQGGAVRTELFARIEGRARTIAELRSPPKAARATWEKYGEKRFLHLRQRAKKLHLILSEMRAQMEDAILAVHAAFGALDTDGGGVEGEEEDQRTRVKKANESEAEAEKDDGRGRVDVSRTMRTAAIDVVNASDLSFERFMREYAVRMRPVIIRGLSLTKTHWNLEHIRRMCGEQNVDVVERHSDTFAANNKWGGLTPAERVPLHVRRCANSCFLFLSRFCLSLSLSLFPAQNVPKPNPPYMQYGKLSAGIHQHVQHDPHLRVSPRLEPPFEVPCDLWRAAFGRVHTTQVLRVRLLSARLPERVHALVAFAFHRRTS